MKILFPLHKTGFDSLQEYEKNDPVKSGEEMLCAILYMDNSDKVRFSDLKKRVENDYVLNKAEYPKTVTAIQILLLNYQPNYNSNINYQSNGVRNQLMFVQRGEMGTAKATEKRRRRDPGEIWITILATTVEKSSLCWKQ